MNTFDYIIVGAGSAGCVLADKLSECGRYQVCLLEAGEKDDHWSIRIPLGIIELMRSRRFNYQFNSAPEPSQNGRQIFHPRGKGLGGSSSINAMLYVRGQAQDYDQWATLGNDGWSWQDVLPYFIASEHQERGESDFHGVNGKLNVADSRSKQAVFDDLIKAALNCGFPENDDFNGATQEGVGYFQVTQKNGKRFSAADAFLKPALSRKNLTVFTNAQVQKIAIEQGMATGVLVTINGKQINLNAKREVILSAGAFQSPQLLMLSGLGDKNELVQHNIEVKQHLPGVGKNLQDHVDALIVSKINRSDLLAYRPKAGWHFLKQAWRYWQHSSGLFSSQVAEAGGFIKSQPHLERPDLQLHFIPAAMDDHGRNHTMLLNYGVSVHTCLLRPNSRGSVELAGNKACMHPLIHTNMLADEGDLQTMINGVKIVRNILTQMPIKTQIESELLPGAQVQSDDEIIDFLKQKANTIYHPVGTCKMGNDDMAVVNNKLQVHGVQNLRVVDASIMPTLISGNTNAPTIMIAAKAADMILNKA